MNGGAFSELGKGLLFVYLVACGLTGLLDVTHWVWRWLVMPACRYVVSTWGAS